MGKIHCVDFCGGDSQESKKRAKKSQKFGTLVISAYIYAHEKNTEKQNDLVVFPMRRFVSKFCAACDCYPPVLFLGSLYVSGHYETGWQSGMTKHVLTHLREIETTRIKLKISYKMKLKAVLR